MFLYNDPATSEIYTLALHDALPISHRRTGVRRESPTRGGPERGPPRGASPRGAGAILAPPISYPRPRHRQLKRSEEHTSELQSQSNLVCSLLLEKKNIKG